MKGKKAEERIFLWLNTIQTKQNIDGIEKKLTVKEKGKKSLEKLFANGTMRNIKR